MSGELWAILSLIELTSRKYRKWDRTDDGPVKLMDDEGDALWNLKRNDGRDFTYCSHQGIRTCGIRSKPLASPPIMQDHSSVTCSLSRESASGVVTTQGADNA